MKAIGYNTAIAMELASRMLLWEVVSRRFGFKIPECNEVEYMFHALNWEKTDNKAEAAIWLVRSNFDEEETLMHVVLALATIPCVDNVGYTDALKSYIIVRFKVDLSNISKISEWLLIYQPVKQCLMCGGEYELR
jgi:hypothetical protein